MSAAGAGRRVESGNGRVTIAHLGARTSHFVVDGFLDDALAAVVAEEGSRIVAAGQAVALHDWWTMSGYASSARGLLTDWMLKHRHSFEAAHILVNSGLVAMGVTVANVALGGFLRASRDREAFDALVDQHVQLHAAQRRG